MSKRQVDEPVEQDDVEESEPAETGGPGQPDLAELGRRYAVAPGLTQALRDGFRELKRHPNDAKRLVALLRGLARKHEPEARQASAQITRAVESIQRGEES
jgi:hypothetical protein